MNALAVIDLEEEVALPIDPLRRAAIVRLLETRDQHLPEPRRRDESARGFVHRTLVRQTCPDCLANDRTLPGCATCDGRGYTEAERIRDPYAIDKVAQYGLTGVQHEATHERDRQIDRLAEQLRPPRSAADLLAEANRRPDAWEAARAAMYRRYDYRFLDQALELLRLRHEAGYHVLHQVFVYRWVTTPAGAMAAVAEAGLEFVDGYMPALIRAPAPDEQPRIVGPVGRGAGKAARATRNQQIRALDAEGRSAREIAGLCACSVATVYEVLNGEAA